MNNPIPSDQLVSPADGIDSMKMCFDSNSGQAYDPAVSVAQELGKPLDFGLGQPG